MAQLIKSSDIKVITKDGECKLSISIDLNINLNTLGVAVNAQAVKVSDEKEEKKKDDVAWQIPDFANVPKLNFGKKS